MVAISLYKGNLHKVPDVPRRWTPPTPKISLKDFKILLNRRARALSRLRLSAKEDTTTSSPSPNSRPSSSVNPSPGRTDHHPSTADNAANNNDGDDYVANHCFEPVLPSNGDLKEVKEENEKVREEGKVTDEMEDFMGNMMDRPDALVVEQNNLENVKYDDKSEVVVNQKSGTGKDASGVEKRKKEVKEKLEILNEKKHSLVQVLKQILSAEEHLKIRNSPQGISGGPPLQVDTTTDFGSMTKVNTSRMGSDVNPCGDMEGVEGDDTSNQNIPSLHLPRTSSTSPSSDSQHLKPATSAVPQSYRTTTGVAGRLMAVGQGHSSISVSRTSYIASSPSPAASSGTSVFRDGKLPSPRS